MGGKFHGRNESDYVNGWKGGRQHGSGNGSATGVASVASTFLIFLSGLFGSVEEQEKECRREGISFVDDVAWVVEGEDVGECTQRLEGCAEEAQKWAKQNACQFDIKKTEAILFTRKRNNWEPKMKARIRVGNHEVQYNKDATRWL